VSKRVKERYIKRKRERERKRESKKGRDKYKERELRNDCDFVTGTAG
jgi:hypothetical protein